MQSTTKAVDIGKAAPIVACVIASVVAANGVTVERQTCSQPCMEREVIEEVVQFNDSSDVTYTKVALWSEFQDLVKEWRETRAASSAAQMAMVPAYQRIIGLGPDVIPLILAQLKSEGDAPDHWFWALAILTRDNPVPQSSRGKVREMAKAWLDWGTRTGHVQLG